MRAVVFDSYGGPEVVRVDDVPEPHAEAGQVRVKVKAASINPVDVKLRSGAMAGGAKAPDQTTVLGFNGAGEVDEVGEGVSGVSAGDAVFGSGQGTQAEYAVLSAWTAKPDDLGWSEAGALGVIGETAVRVLTLLGVGEGTSVFIDGATGGVGKIAVQVAKARGARVIASGSHDKQDLLVTLGAEPVVYGDGVADRVRAVAEHIDAVFDVAGKTSPAELASLVSEPSQVVSIANFSPGDSGIRVSSGQGGGDDGPDPAESLRQIADLYRNGRLDVEVDDVLPFDYASEAYQAVEKNTRKVVLIP